MLQMQHLLQQIHAAKSALEATVQEPEKKSEKSGFAAFFDMSSYFEDNSKAYGDMSVPEVKKVVNHLEQTVTHFCQLFGVGLLVVIESDVIRNQSFFIALMC